MQTRRDFVTAMAAAAACTSLPALGHGAVGQASMSGSGKGALTIMPGQVIARVPDNFTGLSYESAQLIYPGFFSRSNTQMVSFLRTLGHAGVLRIGGNTSAFTTWTTDEAATSGSQGYGPDRSIHDPGQVPGVYKITPHAINELNGFLEATGWGLIYGLNLKNGTPDKAAEEAAYVAKVCGKRLLALQFGNEPDLFTHGATNKEGARWTYDDFIAKWKAMYAAVHPRVPGVVIAGPDGASSREWPIRFLTDTKGMAGMLTGHYYAEGPPTDPSMTIERLLTTHGRLDDSVLAPLDAAKAAHVPFRMAEGNSCYQGGRPGVSNSFGSALWAADFMLLLAARGAVGVNFHGGGNGVYTPIAGTMPGQLTVRPDFYGMLFGEQFAGHTMVATQLDAGGANVTAYAARAMHGLQAAVINKSSNDVSLALHGQPESGARTGARVWRMRAPSVESTSGVQFGAAPVSQSGAWELGTGEALAEGALHVPAYSAALVRWND